MGEKPAIMDWLCSAYTRSRLHGTVTAEGAPRNLHLGTFTYAKPLRPLGTIVWIGSWICCASIADPYLPPFTPIKLEDMQV